jgi:hypothetical protein
MSSDPRDRLLATLDWSHGQWKRSAEYAKAPMYFDACLAWHQHLSADDQRPPRCRRHRQLHKGGIAAALPPARGVRCDDRGIAMKTWGNLA